MSLEIISAQIHWFILYGIILYGVSEMTSKSKIATLGVVIFPFLLLPMIAGTTFNGWFNIVKSFTMVFVVIYGTIVRFSFKKKWAIIALAAMLHINMLEAILKDFQSANYINVISGMLVLLILALPTKAYISEKTDEKPAQLLYPMSWAAIIAYCLWHMGFMYGYESVRGFKGDYLIFDIAILAVPVLAALTQGRQYFFQSRLYTLAFVIILVEATLTRQPEIWPLSPNVYTPVAYTIFVSLVLIGVCTCMGYLILKQPQELADTPLGFFFKPKEKKQVLLHLGK